MQVFRPIWILLANSGGAAEVSERVGGLTFPDSRLHGNSPKTPIDLVSRKICAVHHRVPGVSRLELMTLLCPGCHAKVEHTKMVLAETPLLLEQCQEQHPKATNRPCWLSIREGKQLKRFLLDLTTPMRTLRSVEAHAPELIGISERGTHC